MNQKDDEDEEPISNSSSNTTTNMNDVVARTNLQRGTALGAASLALVILAKSLTLPHQQGRRDELGCDSMCVGSLTSARSALTLLGATVIGRWSDYNNDPQQQQQQQHAPSSFALLVNSSRRKICLWLGVSAVGASIVVANRAASPADLWLSDVLPAAFQQNVNLSKALVGDYQERASSLPQERASTAGLLGMAAGLAMMAGPLLGVYWQTTPDQATQVAMVFLIVAATLICMLPNVHSSSSNPHTKQVHHQKKMNNKRRQQFQDNGQSLIASVFNVPSAKSPAAIYLLTCRLLSALAYQIFNTLWTVYMKEVLGFGPPEYGRFYSFTGLFFALSQGFLAKYCLDWFGGGGAAAAGNQTSSSSRGRVRLLVLCTVSLAVLRCITFSTVHIGALYVICFLSIAIWGIISTIFAADVGQVAHANELGGFFGLQAAVESFARMAGPLLGAALDSLRPTVAPLVAVVGLNLTVSGMVLLGYDRIVWQGPERNKKQGNKDRILIRRADHKIKQC